jgi:flagellar motor component MotA
MSVVESDDIVWETLVETAKEMAPDISIEFLRKAYEIQKKHQFSQEHNESLQLLEQLIDDQIGGAE